jgi:adenosine/AMP kinase
MEMKIVPIVKPESVNIILGQAHFIQSELSTTFDTSTIAST